MFKLHTMSSSNQTHRSNKWPNCSFSKKESKEDFAEGSEVEEEDLVEEEDEVMNQSSVTHVGYLGIIRENALMRSLHTVQPVIIMSKTVLS